MRLPSPPSSASRDDDDSLLRPWHNSTINSSRLLLALKAALACMLAYMVAPFMPGVVAQYPYYAPLGALVAMYPSLTGSLRTAGQTLLGLGVGMLLALTVQLTPWPVVITLFPAIALGVILAGVRRFGAGADYIPITALFVLVVGGPNADNYSLGYIVQMATGVTIGLIVNYVVAQPVDFRSASLELGRIERLMVFYLRDVAMEVRTPGSTSRTDWVEVNYQLASVAAEVRGVVEATASTAKGNPRMMLPNKKGQDPGLARLIRVEHVSFYMRDLTDALRRLFAEDGSHMVVPADVSRELERTLRAVAEVMRVAWKVDTESFSTMTTSLSIVPLNLDDEEKDEVQILAARARARVSDLSNVLEDLEMRNTWDHWWLVTVGTDLERVLQVVTTHGASNPPPKARRSFRPRRTAQGSGTQHERRLR